MNNKYLKYSFLFFFLILCQAYVFGRINFMGAVNPQVFILFILLVPVYSQSGLMILGFLLGFGVDLLMGSGGMHAASSVCIAFVRPFILRLVSERSRFDSAACPVSARSKSELFRYFALSTVLQSLIVYLLDAWHLYRAARAVRYALISAGMTWVLSVLIYPFVRDSVRS